MQPTRGFLVKFSECHHRPHCASRVAESKYCRGGICRNLFGNMRTRGNRGAISKEFELSAAAGYFRVSPIRRRCACARANGLWHCPMVGFGPVGARGGAPPQSVWLRGWWRSHCRGRMADPTNQCESRVPFRRRQVRVFLRRGLGVEDVGRDQPSTAAAHGRFGTRREGRRRKATAVLCGGLFRPEDAGGDRWFLESS